jgi:hypothetical protein
MMADCEAELACVDVDGARRRVRRDMDGILLAAGDANRLACVEKKLRARPRSDPDELCGVLASSEGRVAVMRPEDPEQIFGDAVAARV